MSNKKTWLFAVTHAELEDMGFAPEVFEHLNEPVGLRLTASDVRRGLDEPRIKDGNVHPVDSDEAMSVIKRLKSETASVRLVSDSVQRGLKESNEQMLRELGVEQKSGDSLKEDIVGLENKLENTEKQLETVKERNEKLIRENKELESEEKAACNLAQENLDSYVNRTSQYTILKGQYDEIKGRHDDDEERLDMFENRYGVYDWDKMSLPLKWHQKVVAWFWRI